MRRAIRHLVPEGGSWAFAWSMCPGDGAPCFAARPGPMSFTPGLDVCRHRGPRRRLGRAAAHVPRDVARHGDERRAARAPRARDRGDADSGLLGHLGGGLGAASTPTCGCRRVAPATRAVARWSAPATPSSASPPAARWGSAPGTPGGTCSRSISASRRSPARWRRSGFPATPVQASQTVAFSPWWARVVGPTAALRPRALYRDGRARLGTVRCPVVRCTAVVKVEVGAVTRTRTLHVTGTEVIEPLCSCVRVRGG